MAGKISVTEQRLRMRSKPGRGRGLLDWIKLCRRFKQENGAYQQIIVTVEELQRHNTEDDCWTAFRGCNLQSSNT